MPTKIGTLSEYQGNTYRAYEGPDVGGFGLLPQSAVPRLSADQTLPSELGRWGIDEPLPLGDLMPPNEPKGKATLLGPLSAVQARIPPETAPTPVNPSMATTPTPPAVQMAPDIADTRLVNETAIPRGGNPVQLNVDQAAGFALYDKMQRVQQAREAEKGKRSFMGNVGISAQKRIADALLATPGTLANIGTYPGRSALNLATGHGLPDFSVFPTPSVDDAAAYARSLKGDMTYKQARENIDIAEGAREYERPTSTTVGNVAGDVATVLMGRVPAARAVVAATKSPQQLEAIRKGVSMLPPSVGKQMKTVWNSESLAATKRALGKAAETGFEGASLALLHEGDPVKTGAYAAGGQLAGSFALSAIKHPVYSMGTIAASALMWQMFKDAIPGGRDRILESAEHATHVATAGTILGGIAGVLGAGRFRGGKGVLPGAQKYPWYGHNFAQNVPEYAEGVNAALRTGPSSLIEQYRNDEKSKAPVIGVVMDKLSSNVNAFSQAEISRLTRVIKNGGSLRNEIQDMLKNEDFATRMGM